MAGVVNVAALSLAIGYRTVASAPHFIANGLKNLLAIATVSEVEFKEAETIKKFIKDPSNFVAAAATGAPAAANAPAAAEEKKEEKEDSESADDMGFRLFN